MENLTSEPKILIQDWLCRQFAALAPVGRANVVEGSDGTAAGIQTSENSFL